MSHDLGTIRKVLLLRRKALGDCLVTLPAVRQLQESLPDATLELVVDRPFAPLIALLAPSVVVTPWHASLNQTAWYRRLLQSRYDLVVDWLGNPRTALWTAATGARLRVGYDLPRRRLAYNIKVPRNRRGPLDLRGFAGEAFLDPLRSVGLDVRPWDPTPPSRSLPLVPEGELGAGYRQWREHFFASSAETVAMMVSATWPAKSWPIRHITDLWKQLAGAGLRGVIIPGPGDEAMMEGLVQGLPPEAFAPPTTLLELADLLSRCTIFAGTDCGGRHLAAALGLPTVTVFGPTDSMGWNPATPRHVSLSHPVECLGCDHKICPRPGRPCLEELPAERVLAGIESIRRII